MKWLPCDTCHAPALAVRPNILHSLGTMHDPSVTYLCKRCGRNTTLTSPRFAQLPEMSHADVASRECDLAPEPATS